jgi:hypothetical protein
MSLGKVVVVLVLAYGALFIVRYLLLLFRGGSNRG